MTRNSCWWSAVWMDQLGSSRSKRGSFSDLKGRLYVEDGRERFQETQRHRAIAKMEDFLSKPIFAMAQVAVPPSRSASPGPAGPGHIGTSCHGNQREVAWLSLQEDPRIRAATTLRYVSELDMSSRRTEASRGKKSKRVQ